VAIISRCRRTVHIKKVSTFSCTPYLSLDIKTGSEFIIFTFEWSISAEVVTYRLDVAFGSLHTQKLHGFEESRNEKEIIQNRSANINTTVASLHLPASFFRFRILRLAQKMERINIVFFGRSDGGQDDQNKRFPQLSSQMWTSATCRNNSRVNCISATEDFLSSTKFPEMVL
jgi:hypothetical protein